MLSADRAGDQRIVGGDRSAGAQGGLHQSGCACTCSACAAGRATRSGSGSSRAEAANPTARSSLHHAGIHAAENSAGTGSQYVHVGDRQIVPGDGQVEIVFQRQSDRILERQIQFAVTDQLSQQRRVGEIWLRHLIGRIGTEGIVRCGHVKANRRVCLPGSRSGQCDEEP